MFADVMNDLKKGVLPADSAAFKKQFDIAMIKKMGVLELPYHFWSSDPKINPSSDHLAWAAFILEDRERFSQVEEVIVQEIVEQLGGRKAAGELADSVVQDNFKEITDKFLRLAPNKAFRQVLEAKIKVTVNRPGESG